MKWISHFAPFTHLQLHKQSNQSWFVHFSTKTHWSPNTMAYIKHYEVKKVPLCQYFWHNFSHSVEKSSIWTRYSKSSFFLFAFVGGAKTLLTHRRKQYFCVCFKGPSLKNCSGEGVCDLISLRPALRGDFQNTRNIRTYAVRWKNLTRCENLNVDAAN